jgi:hypothetical protein
LGVALARAIRSQDGKLTRLVLLNLLGFNHFHSLKLVTRKFQMYIHTVPLPMHFRAVYLFPTSASHPYAYPLITITLTGTPVAFDRTSIPFAWASLARRLARHNCWKRGAVNIVLNAVLMLRSLWWSSPLVVWGGRGRSEI